MDSLIFLFGCLGAASPEIVRLYKLRNRPVKFRKAYFLISALFFLLGGIVAIALPSITLWGAFYSGLSLPIIISGVSGKTPKEPTITRERAPSAFSGPELRVPITLTAQEYLRALLD